MDAVISNFHALAYILVGFYFAFLGFWNLYHWGPIFKVMVERDLPHPYVLLPVCILLQVLTGFMIMFNIYAKLASMFLMPFIVMAVFIFHPFWKYKGEMRALNFSIFIANISIMLGALLLIAVDGHSFY